MSKIAKALRKIAAYLPDDNNFERSPFICDAVGTLCYDNEGHLNDSFERALEFLRDLGMGEGLYEFRRPDSVLGSHDNTTPTEQCDRKAWLHFAADLAEEWGEP